MGDHLPGFGALIKAPAGKKNWDIVYNASIRSPGRINFTLAHEFGHYLLHRLQHPQGFSCGEQDVVRWDSVYGQLEHQARRQRAALRMRQSSAYIGLLSAEDIAKLHATAANRVAESGSSMPQCSYLAK